MSWQCFAFFQPRKHPLYSAKRLYWTGRLTADTETIETAALSTNGLICKRNRCHIISAAHPYVSKYCKTSLWNWIASALDFDQVKLAFAFFRASAFILSSPAAPAWACPVIREAYNEKLQITPIDHTRKISIRIIHHYHQPFNIHHKFHNVH